MYLSVQDEDKHSFGDEGINGFNNGKGDRRLRSPFYSKYI